MVKFIPWRNTFFPFKAAGGCSLFINPQAQLPRASRHSPVTSARSTGQN